MYTTGSTIYHASANFSVFAKHLISNYFQTPFHAFLFVLSTFFFRNSSTHPASGFSLYFNHSLFHILVLEFFIYFLCEPQTNKNKNLFHTHYTISCSVCINLGINHCLTLPSCFTTPT